MEADLQLQSRSAKDYRKSVLSAAPNRPCAFIRSYHPVPQGIHFMVYRLEFGVGLEPCQRTPHPLCPIHFAKVIGNKTFYLAVIKYNAIGFITDQAANRICPVGCKESEGM